MRESRFDEIVKHQMNECIDVLLSKADEYAADTDRLHNFKVAASVSGVTPVEALGGMMVKHTVSVYDLIRGYPEDDMDFPLWREKLTDHINYLIILRALITEELDWDEEPEEGEDYAAAAQDIHD